MDYQVSIIGGGVCGALAALYLGKAGISTCLMDKGKPSFKLKDAHVGRTTSLNLFSIGALKELDIWSDIKSDAQEFKEIYVWDSEGSSSISFDSSEIARSNLGVIVHNQVMLEAIYSKLEKIPHVNILNEATLSKVDDLSKEIRIYTQSGEEISSELLIGADGSLSKVRDFSNISIRTWSYNQLAIVSSVKTEIPLAKTAFQIFTDTGPIALLPLVRNPSTSSLIWSTDEEYGKKILELDKSEIEKELRLKTENKFGEIVFDQDINSFPLHQLHAKKFYKGRSVLIGDAAHTIHPLAGQGLNLGIADVVELTQQIVSAHRSGKNLYDENLLSSYSKKREPESYKMIALMEAFKRGFGSDDLLIKMGRNFAFNFADNIAPLKKRLIREAAGIT